MADPYAAFASPEPVDPYAGFAAPAAAKPAKRPKPKGMLDTALASIGDISDAIGAEVGASVDRLTSDARKAYGDAPGGAGNPGGERAAAADRMGGNLLDVPLAFPRGLLRAGGMSENNANAAVAIGLTGLGSMGGGAGTAAPRGIIPAASFRPNLAARAAKFEASNVQPSLAALNPERGAPLAKFAAEDPVVGGGARRNLQATVDQAGAQAGLLAEHYGTPRGAQIVGENVQSGVTRFAKGRDVTPSSPIAPTGQSSFAAKSSALYDQAYEAIPNGVVRPTAAPAVMDSILTRIGAPNLAGVLKNPTVERIATAMKADAGQISFTDLRALRTWVRGAKGNPELRNNIGAADLNRLESALTSDIYDAAGSLSGGHKYPVRQLQRADRYYRAGSQRIGNALKAFDEAGSGEGAYARIIQAARSGGGADAQKLLSLKRSLAPEEWGDVASNAVNELGTPPVGAVNAAEADAFSVARFVTNYARLSPRGRDILFGSVGGGGAKATALRAQLENLVSVAGDLKAIEAAANASKTSIPLRALATGGGLLNPVTTLPTIATLSGIRGLGFVMTDPKFVRWLVGFSKAETPAAQKAALARLDVVARSNPAIAAIAPAIQQQLSLPVAKQPEYEAVQ